MSNEINAEMILVVDVAKELGIHKAQIFKIMRRLEISGMKRRDASKKNQVVSYITKDEFDLIKSEICETAHRYQSEYSSVTDGFISSDVGVFYLLQLEPEHDPSRFKVGFAVNMQERLRALRCSAPFATAIKTWPCRRTWEQTAIDCVTAKCKQIHTEVFRTDSLEDIVARCDNFFGLMPESVENKQ